MDVRKTQIQGVLKKKEEMMNDYASGVSSSRKRACKKTGYEAGKCGAEDEFGSKAAANFIQFLFPVTVASFD